MKGIMNGLLAWCAISVAILVVMQIPYVGKIFSFVMHPVTVILMTIVVGVFYVLWTHQGVQKFVKEVIKKLDE